MNKTELTIVSRKAFDLVNKYFKDKNDAGGHDYISHLFSVEEGIEKEANFYVVDPSSSLGIFYKKAMIVGLLHDILEDTDCTEEELREIGCDDEMIDAIKSVTRKKEEQYYFDFIERVKKNDIGRLVKIHDLENNMDIKRLNKFGDYEMKRLKKYWYSWKYLRGEITAIECNNNIHPDRLYR